ncbi:MAG: Crp/Fnr family transcriptional regulator [Chitinophagales bacterium]
MEQLIQNIANRVPMTPALATAIKQTFKLETLHKNHQLLESSKTVRKLYFIQSGVFRTYYFHEDKAVTSWFYKTNQWMTSWHSFYSQQVSFENMEALENAIVYSIDLHQYRKLIQAFAPFERFMRLLLEEHLTFMDFYFKGYMFMSAKAKYDLLLSYFPDIELRVKLGYIASYLGISQATLSRLRNKKK